MVSTLESLVDLESGSTCVSREEIAAMIGSENDSSPEIPRCEFLPRDNVG